MKLTEIEQYQIIKMLTADMMWDETYNNETSKLLTQIPVNDPLFTAKIASIMDVYNLMSGAELALIKFISGKELQQSEIPTLAQLMTMRAGFSAGVFWVREFILSIDEAHSNQLSTQFKNSLINEYVNLHILILLQLNQMSLKYYNQSIMESSF